tara:strand:- start:696 stop:1460 length:765 start_codon:yes stop_codon:yes gene_type:complete
MKHNAKLCVNSLCSEEQLYGIDLCEEHFLAGGKYQSASAKKRLKIIISYFRDEDLASNFTQGQRSVMHELFFGTIKLSVARDQINQVARRHHLPLLDITIPMSNDDVRRKKWWEKVEDSSKCHRCQEVEEDYCFYLDGPMLCADCIKNWVHPKSRKPKYKIVQKISRKCVNCSSYDLISSELTINGLNGAVIPAGRLCWNCADSEIAMNKRGDSGFEKCDECLTCSTRGAYKVRNHDDVILENECDGCYWVHKR